MSSSLTVRLDDDLAKALDRVARACGKSRSEIVRDAIRRQVALTRFEALRRRLAPLAEARGWLTDEDVFDQVS
jgi:predicted transcriptional regulator